MFAALARYFQSFTPAAQPRWVRPAYARELLTACTLPIGIGLIDGSIMGVLLKKLFDASVGQEALEIPFAIVIATPFMANLTSPLWARLARGKPKIPFMNRLQWALLLAIAAYAFMPISPAGVWVLIALTLLSRSMLAGIITLRSAVWRLNYPRHIRAQVTSKLVVIMTLTVALSPLVCLSLLDKDPQAFRYLFPTAAILGGLGAWSFGKIRVRREKQQLREENAAPGSQTAEAHGSQGESASGAASTESDAEAEAAMADTASHQMAAVSAPSTPAPVIEPTFLSVLKHDHNYRSYQLWQFVLGASNIMAEALVVKFIAEFTLNQPKQYMQSALLSITLPMTIALLVMPIWARYLDRVHVAEFRTRHSLFFVACQLFYTLTIGFLLSGPGKEWVAHVDQNPLFGWLTGHQAGILVLFVPRIVQGLARGGGMLAWQLGHHDFADRRLVNVYMGIHVTLTGIRGLTAPTLGLALFAGWKPRDIGPFHWPGFDGLGAWMFVAAALGSLLAWHGYLRLFKRLQAQNRLQTQAD